jgi:hypothetical protein
MMKQSLNQAPALQRQIRAIFYGWQPAGPIGQWPKHLNLCYQFQEYKIRLPGRIWTNEDSSCAQVQPVYRKADGHRADTIRN